jgi:YVTN family beta-propeller protein
VQLRIEVEENCAMAEGHATVAGERLGVYEVEVLVGRGGMGEVYRAHDERLDRKVALKILTPRLADDEAFRERLVRESRLAASLDHPNVVPVYDAGEADGRFYLAMRFVEGTDLRALLRRSGALEPERALAIAGQVGEALDAAHERGLVHRDVKPSNVLVDERNHCYLADFGLTQSPSDRDLVTDGQMLGTLDYVAPEQVRGDPVDGRADVYSLGCLLYETLTGDVPFRRPSDVATIYAHLEEEAPAASERRPGLPPAVDAVLRRAMAKEPDARYATCAALVEDARNALGLAFAAPRLSRRRMALASLGALGVCCAAVVAAVLLTGGGGGGKPVTGSLIQVDPASGKLVKRYSVSAHPGVVTTSAGRVWLGDFRDGSLWQLNPSTGDLRRLTSVGEPRDLTSLGNTVWVASDSAGTFGGTIAKYDAVGGGRIDAMQLASCAIGAGSGVVWVAFCPFVDRLSTDDGPMKVLKQLALPYPDPRTGLVDRTSLHDVAVGEGAAWVTGDMVDRRIWRLDPRTGRIEATIKLPVAMRTIAAGEGALWVTAPIDDLVLRIDPATNRITDRIPVGAGASGVAVGDGAVWVTSFIAGTVSRIDPRTRRVVSTVRVGGLPRDVAVGAGGVWVTADAR